MERTARSAEILIGTSRQDRDRGSRLPPKFPSKLRASRANRGWHRVDLHQPLFVQGTNGPAAPWPVSRVRHQLSLDRICVHVFEFLAHLFRGVDIEGVVSALPEATEATGWIRELQRELAGRTAFSCAHGTRHYFFKTCTSCARLPSLGSLRSKRTCSGITT